jgi:hypothetical protein
VNLQHDIMKKTELFDFINDISLNKKDILTEDNESNFNSYMVNRFLSMNISTILYANEMNINSHLPKRMQYDYYLNSIVKQKRFFKYIKHKKQETIDLIKEYYGYSDQLAKQTLPLLDESDITYIKNKLNKGGTK